MLATILATRGRKVLLADRMRHPRFAIGESSTPTADACLAALADRYGIAEWAPLVSYGRWRHAYPDVRRGLKRGFSYFCHRERQPFEDDVAGGSSLLVAASVCDESADTHWMRSDVDNLLIGVARARGAECIEGVDVRPLDRSDSSWNVELHSCGTVEDVTADWIVDASGDGGFSRTHFQAGDDSGSLRCNAAATFGHFAGVKDVASVVTPEAPWNFNPDAAAQHHVFSGGWAWMLRFDCGLTSVGLVSVDRRRPLGEQWAEVVDQHPTIRTLLEAASCVDSVRGGPSYPAGEMLATTRMARMNRRACGNGWVSLPAAFGFVDPLHSTGITHSLVGLSDVAEALLSSTGDISAGLARYEDRTRRQLQWIDRLVSLAYAGLPNPCLFALAAKAYFAAVISQERSSGFARGELANNFLSFEDPGLRDAVADLTRLLTRADDGMKLREYPAIAALFAERLRRFDPVGLFDPANLNRIDHVEPVSQN